MSPVESKTASAAQIDIGVKKKQSHSFLVDNRKSLINHFASKNLPSTNVNVKEMVDQIEKKKDSNIWVFPYS